MTDIDTNAIHAGERPDPTTGALAPPLYQTTSYAHDGPGQNKGYCYTRTGNPTVDVLADKLAALEGGIGSACFGSGLAAVDAVFRTLSPGDHVIVSQVAYGGTVRQLEHYHKPWGLEVSYVDTTEPAEVEAAVQDNTRLLFVETPANPTLVVTPLAALGEIAKAHGIRYAVDNTFHTPALQRPFEHGADVVVHSTTKYLEGHGTTVGGAVVVKHDPALLEAYRFHVNATGSILDPFAAWQTIRGIKTLGVRIRQASQSALTLAFWLEDHPSVEAVHYPGLPSFPGYETNAEQATSGGGVLSFELTGGLEAAETFLANLELTTLGENLGQTETLLSHPATMTHAALEREERLELGIADGLLRVSVGLEAPEDLIEELDRAIQAACPSPEAPVAPTPGGGAY